MARQMHKLACIALSLMGAGVLLGGCRTARVDKSVVAQFGSDTDDAQLEFWHRLNEQPVASNDDAFHALLLYVDGKDPSPDYAARLLAMRAHRMLPAGFDRPALEGVQRGTLAVAIVRTLQIKGGVILRIFGPTPRYAVRELYYEGIYPLSSPQQTLSGSELVGIIGRVEDHQRGNPNRRPAAQLPSEPSAPVAPE